MLQQISISKKTQTIALGFCICFFGVTAVSHFLGMLNGTPYIPSLYNSPITLSAFFFSCIIAPLWEEAAFRHIPISIIQHLSNGHTKTIWQAAILSSIVFGWMHGNGTVSLMYQGAIGFVFAYVYIKNGSCYWSSVILHFLWNLGCIVFVR